jgi:predicted DNA-binding protein
LFDLEDTLGLTGRRPTTFAVRKRTDREPRVRVKLIGVGGMVVQKARVPFTCRVSDDFGITTAEAAYRWKGDDLTQPDGEGRLTFESVTDQVGQASSLPELAFEDMIELEPLQIPTGTGLSFRFESADNDDISGPNVGRSSEFLLRIVTEEELRTDLLRREKEQRQEFERLLKNQEDLVTDSRALEAGVKGQAALTPEQMDQLIQYHKRQKLVGQNTGAIAERMASIVIEVQNNRLDEDGGRLQTRLTTEIIDPMREVADAMIPESLNGLDKVRRQSDDVAARDAALSETIALQTETAAKMKEILEHMVKSEGFQEAVNLLYEIQKAQSDVHSQTTKEQQERIKRILEGDSAKPSETPKPDEIPKP